MANEVIIEEYASAGCHFPDNSFAPIPGKLVTSQILTIANASAQFGDTTAFIRLQSKGTGFWYQLGGAVPSCTANTAPARWLPADQAVDVFITVGTDLKLNTAA